MASLESPTSGQAPAQDIAALLSSVQLFARLSQHDLARLARLGSWELLPAGSVLGDGDEHPADLYVIADGVMRVAPAALARDETEPVEHMLSTGDIIV